MKKFVKACMLVTGGYIIFKVGEVSGCVKVAYQIAKELNKDISN